jgi:hypothetical protein
MLKRLHYYNMIEWLSVTCSHVYIIIRRAQVKVGLGLERRYFQRWNFAISPADGSVCQEKFGIHSIAAVCC